MRTMMMTMTKTRILREWRPASTRSYKPHRKPTFPRRTRGLPRDCKARNVRVAGRRRRLIACASICLLPPLGVGPTYRHDLPKHLVRATESRLLGWGR